MTNNINQSSLPAASSSRANSSQTYAAQLNQYNTQAASTAPTHSQHYSQQSTSNYGQSHPASSISNTHTTTALDHFSTPPSRYPQNASVHRSTTTTAANYNTPRPSEVFHLPESANAAIPSDIREQFQRDDKGNVLFFTTPPVDVLPTVNEGSAVGHTARYLANKLRRKMAREEERKAAGLPEGDDLPAAKKLRATSTTPSRHEIEGLRDRGLELLIDQMNQGTEQIYMNIYGEQWEEGMRYEQEKLGKAQEEARARAAELEASARKLREQDQTSLRSTSLYLDDYDSRY